MPILQWQLRTSQVARICGVPYRTLDDWMRTDLLPEPVVPARGTGNIRLWGVADTVRARLVARLRRGGVSLQAVRKALVILADEWRVADPLARGMMLAIDGKLYWAPDDATLAHILARQRAMRRVVLVDLRELTADTAKKVPATAMVAA